MAVASGATFVAAGVAVLCVSCTEDLYRNLTSPLGEGQVGSRGSVSATFVNNTPFRAIFTVATFNHFDQNSIPSTPEQFADGSDGTNQLEGNSAVGPFTFQCDRALSIGGIQMLERLTDSTDDLSTLNEDALATGVGFSAAAVGDNLATLPTEGTAEPLDVWQGAEFQCESLIVITFEQDPNAPGGFRIDHEVILPP
jgi:hypothetical protein